MMRLVVEQGELEEMKTSLPAPTQREELVTASPIEVPELPMWVPVTPTPAEASLAGLPLAYDTSQGAEP